MEQEKKVKALDRYLMPGDVWALTSPGIRCGKERLTPLSFNNIMKAPEGFRTPELFVYAKSLKGF